MWFDVDAALAEIMASPAPEKVQPETPTPAKLAKPAKQVGEAGGYLANLAGLAAPCGPNPQNAPPAPVTSLPDLRAADDAAALGAFAAGHHSPGAIATATGMGATRAWQTVDRLTRAGRLGWAKGCLVEVQA